MTVTWPSHHIPILWSCEGQECHLTISSALLPPEVVRCIVTWHSWAHVDKRHILMDWYRGDFSRWRKKFWWLSLFLLNIFIMNQIILICTAVRVEVLWVSRTSILIWGEKTIVLQITQQTRLKCSLYQILKFLHLWLVLNNSSNKIYKFQDDQRTHKRIETQSWGLA